MSANKKIMSPAGGLGHKHAGSASQFSLRVCAPYLGVRCHEEVLAFMIQTLEIELLEGIYFDQPWSCTLEIPVDHSLEELHLAIQNAVDFENDHLYEFIVGNSARSRSSINFDCQSDEIYETSVEKLLEGSKGKKVFYYFDFGDSWLFQIKKSRKKPVEENPDTFYPKVVSENGKKPIQYPDWDEM